MRILILDCHKNRVQESEKIANALQKTGEQSVDICEVRKLDFPNLGGYDMIVVSGADSHTAQHLWVRKLRKILQSAVDSGKPILGVCYGNELLGELFGFETVRLENPEVGWLNIELTEAGKNDQLFKDLPASLKIFEHHIKAVDIPIEDERILAKSDNCVQAVKYSPNIYGVQFHAEDSPESGVEYLQNDPHCKDFESATALKPSEYVEWKVFKNFLDLIGST
jgi:GMP synthase-like glutamine amidotransferase